MNAPRTGPNPTRQASKCFVLQYFCSKSNPSSFKMLCFTILLLQIQPVKLENALFYHTFARKYIDFKLLVPIFGISGVDFPQPGSKTKSFAHPGSKAAKATELEPVVQSMWFCSVANCLHTCNVSSGGGLDHVRWC